jgi:hypothetical protein
LGLVAPAAAIGQDSAPADRGWRLGAGVGIYRVDDLAGTPVVPATRLERVAGRGVSSFELYYIRHAGFYGLDALGADLGLGVRQSRRGGELGALAGASGMLGGDGDGTPYVAAGVHAAVQGIAWLDQGVGLSLRGTARFWITAANSRFMPSLVAGLVIKL